jgi:malonate transporter and related proteins
MLDVLDLALPFFGLILIGFAAGKLRQIPDAGLAWMSWFIIYAALPALFYRLLARTPFDQFAQPRFVTATTLATFSAFCLAFAIGFAMRRGHVAEATVAGLAGSFGNIGYMGPALALSTLGPDAAAPVALINCFDTLLLFSLTPLLMAVAGARKSVGEAIGEAAWRIVTHPFLLATALGALSAALHVELPVALDRLLLFLQNAAAPCALFTLGVVVALRPLAHMPWEVPFLAAVKLAVHPAIVLLLLSLLGPFTAAWASTAVLMAALPPALNVFILAQQSDSWVAQASGAVLFGTLASVVTLTAVLWLVKSQALPLPLIH